MYTDDCSNPDKELKWKFRKREKKKNGKLKIFFGMCDGVGKTFAMLKQAKQVKKEIPDIVIAYISSIQPVKTSQLLGDFEIIPTQILKFHGIEFEEMDLNAVLIRKPSIVLIDELAHTNIPGSLYAKRYQDVLKILDNGIDVYTTLNIYNLENNAAKILEITGIKMAETIPDSILEKADELEILDITPEDLIKRLEDGDVKIKNIDPLANYYLFRKEILIVFKEMTLNLNFKYANIVLNNSI